jgi:hypothetical protein
MLHVLLYENDFSLSEDLCSWFEKSAFKTKNKRFICPGPLFADALRTRLLRKRQLNFFEDCETVSHYLAGAVKSSLKGRELKGKFDLLLMLGTLWKKRPHEGKNSFSSFHDYYLLFTELRAFIKDRDLFCEVIQDYSEGLSRDLLWLWSCLEATQILDEHGAYYALGDYYRDQHQTREQGEIPILYRFQHLSFAQIYWLNSWGKQDDIILTLPRKVWEEGHGLDWPKWLENVVIHEIGAPLSLLERTIPISSEIDFNNRPMQIIFNGEEDFFDIFGQVNGYSTSFRLPLNYRFSKEKWVTEFMAEGSEESVEKIIERFRQKKEHISPLDERLCVQWCDVLEQWMGLSSANNTITRDEMMFLALAVELKDVRHYYSSWQESADYHFISLQSIDLVQNDNPLCFFISKNWWPSLQTKSFLPSNFYQVMMNFSPLRREGFDRMFYESLASAVFNHAKVLLIDESGILQETEGYWAEFIGHQKIKLFKAIKNDKRKVIEQDFNKVSEKVIEARHPEFLEMLGRARSATFWQKYRDCSLKFAMEEILKFKYRDDFDFTLNPREEGIVAHKLVTLLIEKVENHLSESEIVDLTLDLVGDLFLKKNAVINKTEEITLRARMHLLSLKIYQVFFPVLKKLKQQGFTFATEKVFKNSNSVFIPDFYAYNAEEKRLFVLDFKRSRSGLTSKKDMLNFESLQLPFYVKNMSELMAVDDFMMVQFCFEAGVRPHVFAKEGSQFLKECQFFSDATIMELPVFFFQQFDQILQQMEVALKSRVFKANPRDLEVCTFCSWKPFCVRKVKDFWKESQEGVERL